LTFFPVSLLIQFTRVINIFYLFNVILQYIPSISTNDPLMTLIPLLFVIAMGMLREGLADHKRNKEDRKTNNFKFKRVKSRTNWKELEEVRSRYLRVGDILELTDE
jgi:phospholipid-translocating ATPase